MDAWYATNVDGYLTDTGRRHPMSTEMIVIIFLVGFILGILIALSLTRPYIRS
jgi:hypothetical protein